MPGTPCDWDDLLPEAPEPDLRELVREYPLLGVSGQWHRSRAERVVEEQERFAGQPGDVKSFCAFAMYSRWPAEELSTLLHAEWAPQYAAWKRYLLRNPRLDPVRRMAMSRAAGLADTVIPISRRAYKAPGTMLLWRALEDTSFRQRAQHLILSPEALDELRAEEVLTIHEGENTHVLGEEFSLLVHLRPGLEPFRMVTVGSDELGRVSRSQKGLAVHLQIDDSWRVLERRP